MAVDTESEEKIRAALELTMCICDDKLRREAGKAESRAAIAPLGPSGGKRGHVTWSMAPS